MKKSSATCGWIFSTYLLALALTAQANDKICSDTFKTAAEKLQVGEVSYREDGAYVALDPQTVRDLGIEELIFPILNRTHTSLGAARLSWLLENAQQDATQIRLRQEAVGALMSDSAFRQALKESLDALSDSTRKAFQDGLTPNHGNRTSTIGRVTGSIAALSTAIAVLTRQYSMLSLPIYMGATASHSGWSLRTELYPYQQMFELAQALGPILQQSHSANLREIGNVFASMSDSASQPNLNSLRRSLRNVGSRQRMAVLDALGWASWTLPPIFRSLEKNKDSVAILFSAIAELDTYLSLAEYSIENAAMNTFPHVSDSPDAVLQIEEGHHPYLASKYGAKSVGNSISLSPTNNFVILTGSNMGGKTTSMRMIALLPLVGRTGVTVPAKLLVFSTHTPLTSIDVADSIRDGKSYFDAETDRMLTVIKRAEQPGKILVALDEAFLGTNPEERVAMIQAIIKHFTATNHLYLLSTHDLAITQLAEQYASVSNMHVEEAFVEGKMVFSYKLKDGPAVSRNGIKVLEMKGFPKGITDEAQRNLEANGEKRRM